jgi:threonine aldolase
MFFASDNGSPAAPEIMDAVQRANSGNASAYGGDDIMPRVTAMIQDIFEAPDAVVYLVATGTAANCLALATITQPWQTIFAHRNAHIEEDECGAPEFFTGGSKITLIDGEHARMTPKGLSRAIKFTGRAGVHNVQHGALSITNATENGTLYTPEEIAELSALAKDVGMLTHLDGARFTNALVRLGCSPAELTWKAGVDVVSFGGTKNGCMGVEAVVIFDPKRAWEFELRRKRAGHLFSKHRFLSAQMEAYLTNGLWLDLAKRANAAADHLVAGLKTIDGIQFDHPPQANTVFASFPRGAHRRAQDAGAYYYFWPFDQTLDGPDDEILSARFVCSWSTKSDDIDTFIGHLKSFQG